MSFNIEGVLTFIYFFSFIVDFSFPIFFFFSFSDCSSFLANRSVSGRGSSLGVGGGNIGNVSASYRSSPDPSVILTLQKELQEERNTIQALEKERDFYFGKLRDIEVLIQDALTATPEMPEAPFMKQVQGVLYNTEEGFELPLEGTEEEEVLGGDGGYPDETF